MCKVYEFPMKKEFPKELKGRLDEIAKDYVNLMTEAIEVLYGDESSEEDNMEFMEIMMNAYTDSMVKAISEL